MRSRPLAVASAIIALSTFASACGEDSPEETIGSTPAPAAVAPTTDPAAATTATSPEATNPAPGSTTPPEGADKVDSPITEVAAKNPDLTNLTTALGATGLGATLSTRGPYTVFAPNNDAFAKLGTQLDTLLQPAAKDDLTKILEFHVVKGRIEAKELKDGDLLTTLQGTRLRVSKSGNDIEIGNGLGKAKVVAADQTAGNGVAHVIDSVLTPKKK